VERLGFNPHADRYKGLIAVAVPTGFLPKLRGFYRVRALCFFCFFASISHLLWGYVTAKRFGIMEDLSTGAVREWGDWRARKKGVFEARFRGKTVSAGLFEVYTFPIAVFNASNDIICPSENIATYWPHISSSAEGEMRLLQPHGPGAKTIGHAGFFRKSFKDSIWPRALGRLRAWG